MSFLRLYALGLRWLGRMDLADGHRARSATILVVLRAARDFPAHKTLGALPRSRSHHRLACSSRVAGPRPAAFGCTRAARGSIAHHGLKEAGCMASLRLHVSSYAARFPAACGLQGPTARLRRA